MNFVENFYIADKSDYESVKSKGKLESDSLYFVTDSSNGTQFVARGSEKIAGSFIIEDSIPTSPIRGVLYYIKSYGTTRSPFIGQYNGSNWESIFEYSDNITNRYRQSDGTIVYSERFNDKRSTSIGSGSHAEGVNVVAGGILSSGTTSYGAHAEGFNTHAIAPASHAEGYGGSVDEYAMAAHVEGYATTASGMYSHAEGIGSDSRHSIPSVRDYNGAVGMASHVEGGGVSSDYRVMPNNANGMGSHAEGILTIANGNGSHAEGYDTVAQIEGSHAEGRYNYYTNNTIHSVGIGTSSEDRVSAHEIMLNGDHFVYGIGGYDGTNSNEDGVLSLQSVINKEYKKFVVVGVWGQSNAVGYDEGVVNNFDVPKYTNRLYQVSAISGAIRPLTYCAENLQNMNTVIPKGYTNDRESTPKPDQGTKGIHLPLANLICDAIPDDYGVIIVPYAYGGQGISYFLNDARVNGFTNNIKYALDLNDNNVFGGIVWCQGENDASNMSKDTYKTNFTNLVNKVNDKLQSYVGRTSGNKIDASVWYFYEYPKYFRQATYGYAVMDAIKEVIGDSNYVSVPENHPVNLTRYTSSTKEAHYAGDYFRTYIAPCVFNCMNSNGAFFTNKKTLSEDTVKNIVSEEMTMTYVSDQYQIINEGDYIRYGDNNFIINDGSIRFTLNSGMFEFGGNTFETHIDSSSLNGMMFLIGMTDDGRTLELYVGNNSSFKPLFQRATPTSTAWSNVLTLKDGIVSSGGQITYNSVNAWCKTSIDGSTLKFVKNDTDKTVSVYKDNLLLGTVNLSDISDELRPAIGFGSFWTGGGNNVLVSQTKGYPFKSDNVKDVVSDLLDNKKDMIDALKNIMDSIGQPIILSPSMDNVLRWYNLRIRPDGVAYIHTNLDNSNVSYYNQIIENDDRFCWAFVGNFVNGFKIYNKKFPTLAITLTGGSNTLVTMTENGSTFKLYPSYNNNYPYPYFALGSTYNGTQLYLNKLSGGVGVWTGTDIGSTFKSFPCA